jgi:phenylalanyl-tRNA synthetase beta chain
VPERLLAGKHSAVELENPPSSEFRYLRQSLEPLLVKNIRDNFRFFSDVKLFEIGKVFVKKGDSVDERSVLGMVLASKERETFFTLKGVIKELFQGLGLLEYDFAEGSGGALELKIGASGKKFGFLKNVGNKKGEYVAYAEIMCEPLLQCIESEHTYRDLPKYPSVVRDISFFVGKNIKLGDIIQTIYTESKFVEDVEFVDEYFDVKHGEKQSVTLRIVFQAPDRTLTGKEVDGEIKKIALKLTKSFKAEIR